MTTDVYFYAYNLTHKGKWTNVPFIINSLEIDNVVIEAVLYMGASPHSIIVKVLIPETKPSLIVGAAIVTAILEYSAMVGIVGCSGTVLQEIAGVQEKRK